MNEWVIVGIVAIVVIFGATKLPEIARNLGRSSGEFKKGLKEGDTAADAAPPAEEAPRTAPPPPAETPATSERPPTEQA